MVAVGIPIVVGIFLCGTSAYNKVALGIAVKSSDDIEQGGFAAARLTEYGHKFVLAEFDINTLKRSYNRLAFAVMLCYIDKFEHKFVTFQKYDLLL
jgi:hypothetical protein